jgi:hypothetical protein
MANNMVKTTMVELDRDFKFLHAPNSIWAMRNDDGMCIVSGAYTPETLGFVSDGDYVRVTFGYVGEHLKATWLYVMKTDFNDWTDQQGVIFPALVFGDQPFSYKNALPR